MNKAKLPWYEQALHLLAVILNTIENALGILNGPFLTGAAFIASFALVMQAMNLVPSLGILWAVLILLGVDVQFIACARRGHEAEGWAAWGWNTVTALLAIPMLQTNAIFSLRLGTGIDELTAMAHVWLDPDRWSIERAVLLVIMVWISAVNRPKHHPLPVVVAPTPPPAPAPQTPTTPDKPGTHPTRRRRDIGRTVEETEALKRRARPAVLALAADGQPHRQIAQRLSKGGEPITQFMVGQIIKEAKRETQEVA